MKSERFIVAEVTIFFQCSDTVGWLTGKTFFQNSGERKLRLTSFIWKTTVYKEMDDDFYGSAHPVDVARGIMYLDCPFMCACVRTFMCTCVCVEAFSDRLVYGFLPCTLRC